MTLDEISRLVAVADRQGLADLTVSVGGCMLTLRRGEPESLAEAAPPLPALPAIARPAATLPAPAAGFFRASHPSAPAAGPAGDRAVTEGEIVAFLQVGPCLRPVTAPGPGRVGPALVADGNLVGFGTALFGFEPVPLPNRAGGAR